MLAAFAACSSYGADYWISPSGTGSSPGTQQNPMSKSQIDNVLNSSMGPGDTLYLTSGDYGATLINLDTDGTSGSPKRIIGVDTGGGYPHFSGNGVWSRGNPESGQWRIMRVNGDHWEVENLELSGARYVITNDWAGYTHDAAHVHFKNIDIHDAHHGVYVCNLDDSSFENVTISQYTKQGFRLDGGCDDVTFTSCVADLTGGDNTWWEYAKAHPYGFVTYTGAANTNIAFVDCVSANNRRDDQGDVYWNGDGYLIESTTTGATFDGCIAINNEDGGFDLKKPVTMVDCVSVKNYRGFRMWNGGTLANCVAIYPFRRSHTNQNGSETAGGSGVWTKNGSPTVDYFTFHANKGRGAHEEGSGSITLTNSILSFSGVDGSFTLGNITLGSGTVTYRPNNGTDPDFVNPSITWNGVGNDMNSQEYGTAKGYNASVGGVALEVGDVTFYQDSSTQWHSVTFAASFAQTPVVVMSPASGNGDQPCAMRVRNVSTTGFEFQLDEWNYLNGEHLEETVFYLAMEPGVHSFGGLKWEAKNVSSVDDNWKTVSFGQSFTSRPAVIAQCVTYNGAAAVTTRMRNNSASSIQIHVQEEEGEDGTHADETVAVIAIEQGTLASEGSLSFRGGEWGSVDGDWGTKTFGGSSFSNPAVLLGINTFAGQDTVAARYKNLTSTGVTVKCEEEESADAELAHADETVSYIVFGD